MTRDIIWTKQAQKNFRKIVEYISEKFGQQYSEQHVIDFEKFLGVLAHFPYIGKQDGIREELRSFIFRKKSIVFYRVEKERIVLLNILPPFQSRENNIVNLPL